MDRLIGVFLVALSAACFGTNVIFHFAEIHRRLHGYLGRGDPGQE